MKFKTLLATKASLTLLMKTLSAALWMAGVLVAASPSSAQNPIVPMGTYIADPSSRVMPDGRLYVYGSTDLTPDKYCSKEYHVLSTADLKQWTMHRNSFSWGETLYAPDVMLRDGTYYLYYDVPDGSEYVAVGDSPSGPFRDGVKIEGPRQIDPNIFIDDDGQAYYYWGQFSAKGARMNTDMKTLDLSSVVDGLVTEKEHHFHEGSYVIKRGKYYYYIYMPTSVVVDALPAWAMPCPLRRLDPTNTRALSSTIMDATLPAGTIMVPSWSTGASGMSSITVPPTIAVRCARHVSSLSASMPTGQSTRWR